MTAAFKPAALMTAAFKPAARTAACVSTANVSLKEAKWLNTPSLSLTWLSTHQACANECGMELSASQPTATLLSLEHTSASPLATFPVPKPTLVGVASSLQH